MTITPNPQTVREIAQDYARRLLANLNHGYVLDEMLSDKRFAHLMTGDEDQDIATLDPIAAEIKDVAKAAALSWPDEQPQDERDAELARLRRLLGIGIDRDQWDAIAYQEGARFEHEQTDDTLVGYLAYRYEDMKAQRHILLREIEEAEAAAKAAQDERDGDVRAVAAWLAADDEDVPAYDYIAACAALKARFAGRIAELDARDAKAGE